MRDWAEMDKIHQTLLGSVYPQPEDEGSTHLRERAIQWFFQTASNIKTVIDFGCGEGFCQPLFEAYGVSYNGVALGKDVEVAQSKGRNVIEADFNFLKLDGLIFDAGASFHSLEHSPFPIMTLMSWKKYIRRWLMVVLPHPDWYKFRGQNHFSVAEELQAENWFEQSGWAVKDKRVELIKGSPDCADFMGETRYEIWYLLEKK